MRQPRMKLSGEARSRFATHQRIGLLLVDELLSLRIPAQLAAQHGRDVAEMARGHRAVVRPQQFPVSVKLTCFGGS